MNSIVWKKDISQEYVYCPNSIICDKKTMKNVCPSKKNEQNPRANSVDKN